METKTVIEVTGMTCQHCVKAVTTELSELAGVEDVAVSLGEPATVTVTSDAPLEEDAIRAAVDEAGYAVVAVHQGA